MKRLWSAVAQHFQERAYLFIWAAWLSVTAEYLSRSSVRDTLRWAMFNMPLFLLNVLFVFLLLLWVADMLGNAKVAYGLIAIVMIAPAVVSGIKLRMLGLPLLPSDVHLMKEASSAVRVNDVVSRFTIFALVLFVIVSGLLLYWAPKRVRTSRWGRRIGLGSISLCLFMGLFGVLPFTAQIGLANPSLVWDQAENVRTHGFAVSELLNFRSHAATEPKVVAKALDGFVPTPAPHQEGEEPLLDHWPMPVREHIKPNVIVILSESLWDPTKLKGVSFSRDPLPFLRSLQDRYPTGTMLSPEFGGQTANVEFEVLTGLSMRFLKQGTVPYMHYVKHEVDSLASILTRQGYSATAITPWPSTFFNSNNVYRFMGFTHLVSEEFFRPEHKGPYIADEEVARVILDQVRRTSGPDFIFANTAQNHEPFDAGKFADNTVKVQGVTGHAKELLETYAQGCLDADQMLKTLVDYFNAHPEEPTIITFFGDHLPILGDDYFTYKAAKYITGPSDPDFLNKMHRVPLLVWDNYLPNRPEPLDISPSFLGPYVLERANLPGTALSTYLRSLSKRIPVIPPRTRWKSAGIMESDLEQYIAIQHDILFGDRVAYGDVKGKIIDPDYTLGFGPLVIDTVVTEHESDGSTTLTIAGANFPPQALVYLSDYPITPTAQWERSLRVKVPAQLHKPGTREVQVRVLDPWQAGVVATSNVVTVTLP